MQEILFEDLCNITILFIGSKDDNEESDQEESDHESKSITSCGMCAYNKSFKNEIALKCQEPSPTQISMCAIRRMCHFSQNG